MGVLAIIPARGGSKRIPHKWAQLVAGKPLLQHTIDIARAATTIDRLVVSTEDPAIAAYARLRDVEVNDRPAHLAHDDTTIAAVVRHTVADLDWDGTVVVLQPTCPLLKSGTIDRFVSDFADAGVDWAISVTAEPHLFWHYGRPLTPRVNGQYLGDDALRRESGAVQVMTAGYALERQGVRTPFPIDPAEALDIDTHADLAAARQALGRRRILFHVVATDEKGSGHLRRCLQLSDALSHHDIWWAPWRLEQWAYNEASEKGVIQWADGHTKADLVVIDALGDADHLARRYASEGIPTVVFEPDGFPQAGRFADLVIDEFDTPQLTILRPEFLCLPPYQVNDKAQNVLVTFGGTDPTGMNARVSKIVRHGSDATVLVAGRDLRESMAELMCWADLVVTSQGRTVHEAAAVGVPVVSVAVNERESRHCRLPGVVYLGLAHTVSDAAVLDAVNRLLGSAALRRELSATASRAIDGRGLQRVVRKIEDLLEGVA